MSPLAVERLIFCCTRAPEAGEYQNIGREPQQEIQGWFIRDGVVEWTGKSYRATDKGRAWLNMMCSTPQPKMQWVDPRSNEAVELP